MNKTGFVIVVEEEGMEGSRIQHSTVFMSKAKAIELRNDLLRDMLDEQYADMQQDPKKRVEINTPADAHETGWISVDGTWVVTATIEMLEIDDYTE